MRKGGGFVWLQLEGSFYVERPSGRKQAKEDHRKSGSGRRTTATECECSGNRCGKCRTLRSRADRSRRRTGTKLRQLHGRPPSNGTLAEGLSNPDGSHASHRRVLDGPVLRAGKLRVGSERGACATHQNSSR